MKKQKLLFSAILLMAMALPQSVFAYAFSAVAPTGQTLYYYINYSGGAVVTYPGTSVHSPWTGYTGTTGALTIPSTVTYGGTTYNVISIGYYAFFGCSGLTSVTIPNSVTSIELYAFAGCSSLSSLNIPNSVTSIGRWAFNGCSSLTSVTIPNSVTTIGRGAFYNCDSLSSLTISNSITKIDTALFWGCSSLTTLTIPNSITSIEQTAFNGCSSLTSLTIPNSVTSIGEYAFSGCTSLTSLTIPNSVTTIGSQAFNGITFLYYYGNAVGAKWGALFMNSYLENNIVYSSIIKDTIVGTYGQINNVTIPNSVLTIINRKTECAFFEKRIVHF